MIIGLCMTMLLFALSEVTYMFGGYAWPVTYNVIITHTQCVARDHGGDHHLLQRRARWRD